MKRLGVEITLLAPALLAAAPPASNLTETLRWVPGNSLRGVFARRYLERGGPDDDVFQRIFVSGEAAFGNALRDGGEVVPLSARTCKYDGHRHGVVDVLLDEGEGVCPVCGEALAAPAGYWLPATGRRVEVRTRLTTRTALDPGRGTARHGQLFIQEVLEEGQRFVGCLEAPVPLAEELGRLMGDGFEARLGTGSSRGQGWAQIGPCPPPAESWEAEPADRRAARFRSHARRPVLAVTLLSDGLFVDDYLRAATSPALADLAPLGVAADDWQSEPVEVFAQTRQVFGFDGEPVSLPRPHRLAVAAGSTFLYEAAQDEPHVPEGGGGWIGDGRREGYGRAVLWHPFHLDPGPGRSAS